MNAFSALVERAGDATDVVDSAATVSGFGDALDRGTTIQADVGGGPLYGRVSEPGQGVLDCREFGLC